MCHRLGQAFIVGLLAGPALEAAGKSVRLITFDGEDHSGWDAANWRRQAEEAIAFFRPYLGRRAAR